MAQDIQVEYALTDDLFNVLEDIDVDFVTVNTDDDHEDGFPQEDLVDIVCKTTEEQKQSSNVKSKTSGKKREETNAERCKRQRMKRKEKEREMYLENMALKQERSDFLKKISELEQQVQVSRGEGVVDLSAENNLLRTEIAKHQSYIQKVLRATKDIPLQTADEVNERILREGIQSGIAQVVGLSYSSTSEPSWKEVPGKHLKKSNDFPRRLWLQYLPIGSNKDTATRINFRSDIYGIPVEISQDASQNYWDTYASFEGHCAVEQQVLEESGFEKRYSVPDFSVKEFKPHKGYNLDHVVKFFKISSPRIDPVKEGVVALVRKEVDMFPAAFHNNRGITDFTKPEKVGVVCKTSCNYEAVEDDLDKKKEKLKGLNFGGLIYRPRGKTADCIYIATYEVEEDGALFGMKVDEIVDEDGDLTEKMSKMLIKFSETMLLKYKLEE